MPKAWALASARGPFPPLLTGQKRDTEETEDKAAAMFCLPPLDAGCPGCVTEHGMGTARLEDF